MAEYRLTENARNDVKGASPAQLHYFVMSDRKADATVLAAYISKSVAERFARLRGSCVRLGRVQGDFAVTLLEG
jgi:hypothetical protein